MITLNKTFYKNLIILSGFNYELFVLDNHIVILNDLLKLQINTLQEDLQEVSFIKEFNQLKSLHLRYEKLLKKKDQLTNKIILQKTFKQTFSSQIIKL